LAARNSLRMWVTGKQEWGEHEHRYVSLTLSCDYGDGRNKEWAAASPSAVLQMTVKGEVGDRYNLGDKVEVMLENNGQAAPTVATTE
jgi:hypothetical protein